MTWLEGNPAETTPMGLRFERLLQQDGILAMPGAHNALAGLLARQAGFQALYLSGGAISASLGLPDLGVMTLDDLLFVVRAVARSTGLPLLVDGDTGYGEALNVMRLVRELEAAGAAAVHIEDQQLPKKCGHLNDKTLIPAEQMAAKVAAAVKARTHLRIVVRTDAFASEGLDGLLQRARLYLTAGADAIFPEALTSVADFQAVAAALDCPLLANMTEFGRSPSLSRVELEQLGYKMVIWPVSSLRVAAGAMEKFYATLAREGSTDSQLETMQTRSQLYEVLDYHAYEELDSTIVKTVLG